MTRMSTGTRRLQAPRRFHASAIAAAVVIGLLVGCAAPARVGAGMAPAPAATFILVRHAEKASDDPTDPSLLPSGEQRAKRLASLIGPATLHAVYATRFRRTRETALPTARAHGLELRTYDPAVSATVFAEHLRATHRDGTVLVVGHSNTVPALAAALCACPVAPMPETEYGRYYRLTAAGGGPARLQEMTW